MFSQKKKPKVKQRSRTPPPATPSPSERSSPSQAAGSETSSISQATFSETSSQPQAANLPNKSKPATPLCERTIEVNIEADTDDEDEVLELQGQSSYAQSSPAGSAWNAAANVPEESTQSEFFPRLPILKKKRFLK